MEKSAHPDTNRHPSKKLRSLLCSPAALKFVRCRQPTLGRRHMTFDRLHSGSRLLRSYNYPCLWQLNSIELLRLPEGQLFVISVVFLVYVCLVYSILPDAGEGV